MRGVIHLAGTVAPVRKRNKAREEEYGSIRPMTTMESWDMSAQEAYASKSPLKRMDVVPDIGPAAGMVKAIKPAKLLPKLKSEAGYAYHATNTDNLYDIANSGKLQTHKPDYGTDQVVWPDGRAEKRSYFIEKGEHAYQFAPMEGQSAVLRVKKGGLLRESTGDLYSKKPIASKHLEYLGEDEVWHPVIDLADKANLSPSAGPMVQKAGSGEPYKRMPQSRQGSVSPTEVTPFELQQLGLSKGAEPWDMGSKTTLGPATRPKRGKK